MRGVNPRDRDERSLRQMAQDALLYDKLESPGEWNFLAKDVPAEIEGYEGFRYDIVALDLEHRQVKVEVAGHNHIAENIISDAVSSLEDPYGYIVADNPLLLQKQEDFQYHIPGRIYWEEEDSWMLETSQFEILSDSIFGYEILSKGYQKIDPDSF